MLSETMQTDKDLTYMWNLNNKINEQTKQKQTQILTNWWLQMRGQVGEMGER